MSEISGHYQSAFSRGERVFAISHSQGSLFMSDAWNLLPEGDNKRKYFSGFQVASVLGSEMSSHFGYATHEKDFVVNLVRGAIGALPANLETPFFVNSGFGDDVLLNHGILSTYLNDSIIKPQVISRLIATAQLLESNCPNAVVNYTKSNLAVSFDSTDPENPNVTGLTYSWDFGDGQTGNTTSKTLSHNYSVAGTYNVFLTVTDAYGSSDTASVSVVVSGGAVAFNFKVDYSNSYIKALLLVMDNGFPYSFPANSMFSSSVTSTVTAEVGTSITFPLNSGGTNIATINCGSWIKTSPTFYSFVCTRGENSTETTTISLRDSFINDERGSMPIIFSVYIKKPKNGSSTSEYFQILQRYDMIERVGSLPIISTDPIKLPDLFLF